MSDAFDLDQALPWGRNRPEYLAFFDLLDLAPDTRILDCGAGPSSFTAEMAALGFGTVAAKPLYQRALAIREKALGPEHPSVATSLENYAVLLRETGGGAEAAKMEARVKAIRAK
jgi:hypothetical protein